MPFLDDHRRRVPPQNVYRSIVVCIRALAQGASRMHGVMRSFVAFGKYCKPFISLARLASVGT